MSYLVTGGFGFIGSHLVKKLVSEKKEVVVLDCLTYAANPKYLEKWSKDHQTSFRVERVDLSNFNETKACIERVEPEVVYHLAAESHVCRSIERPDAFLQSNVIGTYNLLESLRPHKPRKIIHVSTDEVFGELSLDEDPFFEGTQIKPRSPYAATKAASDHLAEAYHHTYGLNISITNCSNNFGPNQHEEKLIPATIKRLYFNKPIRLYGNGQNIRDWLYVGDHCEALKTVELKGANGERYCIGGDLEMTNLEITQHVANAMIKRVGPIEIKIEFTNDRPTDDKRYAINSSKLKKLGWVQSKDFEKNLFQTIDYYLLEKPKE